MGILSESLACGQVRQFTIYLISPKWLKEKITILYHKNLLIITSTILKSIIPQKSQMFVICTLTIFLTDIVLTVSTDSSLPGCFY